MPLIRVREGIVNPGVNPDRVFLLGFILLGIATMGFYSIDHMIDSNASGSKIVNAFYCAVATLTTVGYGDICPTSNIPFVGKLFLMWISFMGLGMVCGPLIAVTSSWRHVIPGGWMVVTSMTFGLGIFIFTNCEGLSITDAIYASVMTGTTIGFGDVTPNTDLGKISVAIYALLVVGVVSGMLDTVRDHLVEFCIPPSTTTTISDDSTIWMTQSSSTTFHSKRSNGQKSNRKLARLQQQNQVSSSSLLPLETKQASSSSTPTIWKRR